MVKALYLMAVGAATTLSPMEIREVRPDEYERAGRVTALAYREFVPDDRSEEWEEYLERIADVEGRIDRTLVLVAVEAGRILGSATVELDGTLGDDDEFLPPEMASLRMLGVDPEARGKGVGRALVEACIERARESGKLVLVLRTTAAMASARRLYESMGFRRDPARDLSFPAVTLWAYTLPL